MSGGSELFEDELSVGQEFAFFATVLKSSGNVSFEESEAANADPSLQLSARHFIGLVPQDRSRCIMGQHESTCHSLT